MDELFNLTYKDEVEVIKDEDNFEALGDERYLNHEDVEARLYWAFCRPNGSCKQQIADENPLVSIMAFNHSKLTALERFDLLHCEVIEKEHLRVKIRNRTRMLFRSLIDDDFVELNQVLNKVPVFLPVAVDQLKNGRKWNDTNANEREATFFINRVMQYEASLLDNAFFEALYLKLQSFEEFDGSELKSYLQMLLENKASIHPKILSFYHDEALKWLEQSDLHLLQKKSIEKLSFSLI